MHKQFVAPQPDRNLVFSPLSLQLAYAMALTATVGEARLQLAKNMAPSLDPESIEEALQSWIAELLAPITADGHSPSSEDDVLRLANGIWLDTAVSVNPAYPTRVNERYGATLHKVPMVQNASAVVSDINHWVEEATSGRIKALLDSTSARTAVLVNVAYLQAKFIERFSNPHPGRFFTASRGERQVDFMSRTSSYRVAIKANYQAVEIPLRYGNLKVVAFMPRPGRLEAFTRGLDANTWATLVDSLKPAGRQVSLHWPKFAIRCRFSDFSDLTGLRLDMIAGEEVGRIVHEATINTDPIGIEATAATALSGTANSMKFTKPAPPLIIRLDHPFIYAVIDSDTKAILFLGQLTDP